MLRTLLVGILAVSAAASCSNKGDAPVAQPGVAAGKVLEISGTVTATRGTLVRTLAAGGEISSDDVIDTAADSRVVILVAHNNARWDLGPNRHGKVSESIAWTAAKQDRPATAVIEESSTAGRHAEKTAATTDTTTDELSDDMQTKGGEPEPARAPKAQRAAPAGPAAPAPAAAQETAAPPAAESAPLAKNRAPSMAAPAATRDAKEAPEAPRRESSRRAPMDTGAGGGGGAKTDSWADGPAGDPVRTLQLQIGEIFDRHRVAMRACFDPSMPPVLIKITVTMGLYTITPVDRGATEKSRTCLTKIAKGVSITTQIRKPVSIEYTLGKD